mmetsp:Transcript_14949/g.32002  ORF Transcript_14949/g.32002 Transcript_14949/m.32002 type:complete len:202 (-) Transcript_14949:483-1088(-)
MVYDFFARSVQALCVPMGSFYVRRRTPHSPPPDRNWIPFFPWHLAETGKLAVEFVTPFISHGTYGKKIDDRKNSSRAGTNGEAVISVEIRTRPISGLEAHGYCRCRCRRGPWEIAPTFLRKDPAADYSHVGLVIQLRTGAVRVTKVLHRNGRVIIFLVNGKHGDSATFGKGLCVESFDNTSLNVVRELGFRETPFSGSVDS